MSLWKGKRAQDPDLDLHQIESLLKRAITLDPKLAEAHLQLGNLYSDRSQFAEAIPEYVKALEINAELADAHYRLGQAYVHTGKKDSAQEQFDVYQRLRAQQMADREQQRAEVRQFVYSEKNQTPAEP
jgi:tetratricopeptide (TPR) repeat protein